MDLVIQCPACGESLIGTRSEMRRDINFHCGDCGVQVFIRGSRGIWRYLRIRNGMAVFYNWVICSSCLVAVHKDRLIDSPLCPACGKHLVLVFRGDEEIDELKKAAGR